MTMHTEIQCRVNFGSIGPDKFASKVNLFNVESIYLKGKWKDDSVISYCKMYADKQGLKNGKLEIFVYDDEMNETYLESEI